MTAKYIPDPPPVNSDPTVTEWAYREFSRIRSILEGSTDHPVIWKDYLAPLNSGKANPSASPAWSAFGPTGTSSQWNFDIGDSLQLAFHINHDIKPGSLMYLHVHWTTNGTQTNTAKWRLSYTCAKGHDQANFPADTVLDLTQAAAGTAWRHMITEDTTGITAPEVDSLMIVRIERITNGGTDLTDQVFGLFVDIHYQADTIGTINKAPDFYT